MKKRTRARSSGLFLLELIIAILFFTAASAVCVEFFVKSHTMSQDSSDLNFAVNECSSIAEIVQTSDSKNDALLTIKKAYPEAVFEGQNSRENDLKSAEKCTVFYNRSKAICDGSDQDVCYWVCADFASENGMLNCHVSAEKDGSQESDSDSKIVIYELSVKHALQEVND